MKKTIILIAIICIAFACKKSTTTFGGGGNTTQSTTTSSGFGTGGTNNVNGVLYAQHLSVPSYSISQYQGGATFSKTAKPLSSLYAVMGIPIGGEQAGVLKLDSTVFKYNSTNANSNINTYTDTTNNSIYTTAKWNIGGNANFTAFTATVLRGYPAIANSTYLPATFSKSQPLTINFGATNYTNTDSIVVMITDNTSSTGFIYKYMAGNGSSATFTAAQLSGLSTTSTNSQIIVYAKNYSNLNNGGKNYVFVLENDLIQFVTITP